MIFIVYLVTALILLKWATVIGMFSFSRYQGSGTNVGNLASMFFASTFCIKLQKVFVGCCNYIL